jgi:hypothetical protein
MRLVLMRNIQETVLEYEKFIIEQDLIYFVPWFKNFAGQPQQARLILEANPSNEIKELAELISIF